MSNPAQRQRSFGKVFGELLAEIDQGAQAAAKVVQVDEKSVRNWRADRHFPSESHRVKLFEWFEEKIREHANQWDHERISRSKSLLEELRRLHLAPLLQSTEGQIDANEDSSEHDSEQIGSVPAVATSLGVGADAYLVPINPSVDDLRDAEHPRAGQLSSEAIPDDSFVTSRTPPDGTADGALVANDPVVEVDWRNWLTFWPTVYVTIIMSLACGIVALVFHDTDPGISSQRAGTLLSQIHIIGTFMLGVINFTFWQRKWPASVSRAFVLMPTLVAWVFFVNQCLAFGAKFGQGFPDMLSRAFPSIDTWANAIATIAHTAIVVCPGWMACQASITWVSLKLMGRM